MDLYAQGGHAFGLRRTKFAITIRGWRRPGWFRSRSPAGSDGGRNVKTRTLKTAGCCTQFKSLSHPP